LRSVLAKRLEAPAASWPDVRSAYDRVRQAASRLVASAATRLRAVVGEEHTPSDPARWRQMRESLDVRQATREQGRRFRHDPAAYLRSIEESLIKKTLPS
jgi:hypothetical protein